MKGLKKQIIGALLCAAVSAGTLPVMAQIPEDVAGTRYEEPIQVLSALKIMIGDENGKFRPDDTIIRSEVTKIAIHALGLEEAAKSAAGVTKFPDVPADHWANGYINLATSQGIIIGDENGNFRPNDKITYAEAMTIMVRALGYEPMANKNGGFPNGYILTGNSNGLGDNVTGGANDPISRGNVAYLTVNALETKLMEQTGYGDNIIYEIVDKTLLEDKLHVKKSEGQITAIPSSSLTGNSTLNQGQIKIDDNIFETAYNMNNLLGYNVRYYVKEDKYGDDKVILAMPIKEKNSTLKIEADLFEAVTTKDSSKAIEYYKSESDNKKYYAKLDEEATLIYNGKYNEMDDGLLNLKDKAGHVSLLDTDRNDKYDIVFVTEYENYVVEEVTTSGKIIDKYGKPSLKLDEDVDFRITKGTEEIEVTDLNEYDVLSVAASADKEIFDIVVSNEKVEGKITAKNDNGVYIGGKQYKTASNYEEELNIGMEGVFYLDIEGKIAAVDTASQLSSNYGYMMKAYVASDVDDIVKFKIYTKNGEEKIVEATEKIKYNGKGGQLATEVIETMKGLEESVPSQLITYTLNSDGKLTALNTAADNTASGDADINKFTKNYVLEDAEFNADLNKLDNIRITEDTVIFDIPEDATDSSDFSIGKLSMFEDGQTYNAIVYDRTEDFTAKVIVLTDANFQTNADSSIAVVKSIASATNDDDETTDVLHALVNGKEETIFAETTDILVKNGSEPLQTGDIIQYKTNSNGDIVNIRVLFDVGTAETEKTETPAENLEIVYGKVVKKFTSSINVTVNDENVRNFTLPKDINVYSVDTTTSRNNVNVAEIGDIQAYDEDENNRVFVKLYKGVVQEVVIIK